MMLKGSDVILISIMLQLLSLIFIFVGLHNLDNAYNMLYVEKTTGVNFTDTSLNGKELTSGALHRFGFDFLGMGITMISASIMLLVLLLSESWKATEGV